MGNIADVNGSTTAQHNTTGMREYTQQTCVNASTTAQHNTTQHNRHVRDELGRIGAAAFLRGRRGTFGASRSICVAGVVLLATLWRFAWSAWYYLHTGQRKLGDELGLMWRRGVLRGRRDDFRTSGLICVTGVAGAVLSLPSYRGQRKLGDELGLMWRRGVLRGKRGDFSTSCSICVAGVALLAPQARFA